MRLLPHVVENLDVADKIGNPRFTHVVDGGTADTKDAGPDIDIYASKLEAIANRCRRYGLIGVLATAAHVMGAILLFAVVSLAARSPDYSFAIQWVALSSTLTLSVLVAMISLEISRKSGYVVYDELVDELQWGYREGRVDLHGRAAVEKPSIQLRIVLREFSRAADLLLVPGALGPSIYIMFNIAIFLGSVWMAKGGLLISN